MPRRNQAFYYPGDPQTVQFPTLGTGVGAPAWRNGAAAALDFSNGLYYGDTLANLLTVARSAPALTCAETVAGSLTSFGANALRRTDKGALIEIAETNLALQFADFSTTWFGNTVTVNQALAPDGTLTADLFVPTTGSSSHPISQSTIPVTATSYSMEFFVKPAGYYKGGIREGAITGKYATFDLRGAGSVLEVSSSTSGYVRALANGWYWIAMVYTGTAANHQAQYMPMDAGYVSGSPQSYSFAGDGVSGAYLWGAKVKLGATPFTSPIPTTTAAVARSADVATFAGIIDTILKSGTASILVITKPQVKPTVAGNRLIGSNFPVPLNTASDTQVQNYNGTTFLSATLPFSATFKDNEVWSMTSWDAGQTDVVANGGTVATDAHGMAAITTSYLGSSNGSNALNGPIDRIAVWSTKKIGAEMQAITASGATFSTLAIIAWGDSLTSGNQDGTGTTYPNVLATLRGRAVYNNGIGGQDSTAIKNRFIAFVAGYGNDTILEMGRNNFTAPTTVKADIATCVAALTTTHYLIGSVLPSSGDSGGNLTTIATLNSDLATLYGNKFVDLLAALQAAGNGGANDNADIAAGIIPRSLRATGDGLHLNAAGYTVVANAYSTAATARGWA